MAELMNLKAEDISYLNLGGVYTPESIIYDKGMIEIFIASLMDNSIPFRNDFWIDSIRIHSSNNDIDGLDYRYHPFHAMKGTKFYELLGRINDLVREENMKKLYNLTSSTVIMDFYIHDSTAQFSYSSDDSFRIVNKIMKLYKKGLINYNESDHYSRKMLVFNFENINNNFSINLPFVKNYIEYLDITKRDSILNF